MSHIHKFKKVTEELIQMPIHYVSGTATEARIKKVYVCHCGQRETFYCQPQDNSNLETYKRQEVN